MSGCQGGEHHPRGLHHPKIQTETVQRAPVCPPSPFPAFCSFLHTSIDTPCGSFPAQGVTSALSNTTAKLMPFLSPLDVFQHLLPHQYCTDIVESK